MIGSLAQTYDSIMHSVIGSSYASDEAEIANCFSTDSRHSNSS